MSDAYVLVVDGEPNMGEVMALALRAVGLRVVAARSGEQALLLLHTERGRPRVLVTEIVMPAMSGSELAVQVHARVPEVRVLYVSGYGPGMVGARPVPGSQYLAKPFAVQDFVRTVRVLWEM